MSTAIPAPEAPEANSVKPSKTRGKKKEKKEEKKGLPVEHMRLYIDVAFPHKDGYKRRIPHLWDNYFRINYINEKNGHFDKTAFLEVMENGEIIVTEG